MKKIYYLLVCLFFLQSAFAAGEKQSFDVCLQNGLNMNVEVCTDGIFRIRVTPRSTFSESLMQRYEIIKADWDPVQVSLKDNKQQFEILTGAYRLKIDKKTGAISVSDRKGRVIIEKVVFLTSADPLCTDLGEVINAKYKDMKVPNNGTIIGDDENPGSMKDLAACSPRFRASASVTVQQSAFATGVPPYIYAFHRYTRNSDCLSSTQELQFQMQAGG